MLVSLNSYNLSTPRIMPMRKNNNSSVSASQQSLSSTGMNNSAVSFTGDENGGSLRKAAQYLMAASAIIATMAACSKDDDANAFAEAVIDPSVYVRDTITGDTARNKNPRDTVYITIPGDTVVIDTGSYVHDTITIEKWKDRFVRPIPLDSIMNDLNKFDVDSTSYPNDSADNRNIIHYEATREWEENSKEIGNIYMPESSKKNLVYNTEIRDYLDRHLSYGKTIYRIPSSKFTVVTESGKTLNSPKGYFVDKYNNPTDNKDASVYDCELVARYFVQTIDDTVKVYTYQNGKFVEDGTASKGYLGANTILLSNLIGEYETDDHLTNVKITAVDDEKLKLLYLRQMDEADEVLSNPANARRKDD